MSPPRPGYRERRAQGALACLWVRVAGEEGERTDVLPDACSDLIWRPGRGAFVAGPDTGPVPVESAPGAVLLGIRFRPGAGGPALGLPLSELRDRRVDLSELDPVLAEELHGGLDPREAAARLTAVARRLAAIPGDPAVAAAGYGPKTLQRVLRFRRFLAGSGDDLARAALEAGYADQPHLAREVARLAGTTPGRLIHR